MRGIYYSKFKCNEASIKPSRRVILNAIHDLNNSALPTKRRALLLSSISLLALTKHINDTSTASDIDQQDPAADFFDAHQSSIVAVACDTTKNTTSPQVIASGVIWDSYGHIITSYTAVNTFIRQQLPLSVITTAPTIAQSSPNNNNTLLQNTLRVSVVARDPSLDLIILKIDSNADDISAQNSIAQRNTAATPISSVLKTSMAYVGQDVFALGSTPEGFRFISAGVLSAVDRTLPAPNGQQLRKLIQTDADITPLSIGGGLFSSHGDLMGVNISSFVKNKEQAKSNGVNFALSSDILIDAVPKLIVYGNSSGKR